METSGMFPLVKTGQARDYHRFQACTPLQWKQKRWQKDELTCQRSSSRLEQKQMDRKGKRARQHRLMDQTNMALGRGWDKPIVSVTFSAVFKIFISAVSPALIYSLRPRLCAFKGVRPPLYEHICSSTDFLWVQMSQKVVAEDRAPLESSKDTFLKDINGAFENYQSHNHGAVGCPGCNSGYNI